MESFSDETFEQQTIGVHSSGASKEEAKKGAGNAVVMVNKAKLV